MKTLQFQNGDEMPIVGLGTWKSAPEDVYHAVKTAIQMGYRHIDCAACYDNQNEVGQAITECIKSGIVKRKDLWITSKLWNNRHGKNNVLPALKQTLNELQLDYLDLYLIHWPIPFRPDVGMPSKPSDFVSLEELPLNDTWLGMEEAKRTGLARHIGVSNFGPKNLSELYDTSEIKPEVLQNELHPFLQQKQLVDYCQQHNIHVTAYSPLGSGDRIAMLRKEYEPPLLENKTIVEIADAANCSPAQVILAWSIHRNISVIPKSINAERLHANLNSINISLSKEQIAQINELNQDYSLINISLFTQEGSPFTQETLWE